MSIGPLDFGITLGILIIIYGLLLRRNKDTLERQDIAIIALIGAVGLLLRLISFSLSTEHDYDTLAFIDRSTMVLNGMTSLKDFSDPKPLWTHTLAAWFYFVGISIENLFLLLIGVDVIVILFMFFIGRDVLGKKEGYLASMFYAFNPFTILFCAADGKMDMIPILFAILAFWFLKKGKIDLSAISLGVGIMYKYLAGLYFIPFLFFLKKSWNRTDIIRYVAECAATVALIALPFLLISPSNFITDTFLFFITKDMGGHRRHELHPHGFLPFYVPLIFVWIAWIAIMYLAASINEFRISDELRLLFFFITFTHLLNRSVYTQYFAYTIPILGLMFAQDIIKAGREQLYSYWRAIAACVIPFFLSLELFSNFGFGGDPIFFALTHLIGDMDLSTYLGVAIPTVLLFIAWIRNLRNENRLTPPRFLTRSHSAGTPRK